jgi:hypothetical protein
MALKPVHLKIDRMQGPPRVIANADRLAEVFFSLDRSSVGVDSYDAYTTQTPADRIERGDVDRINGPMRARSKPETWADLVARPRLDWLADVDVRWDLLMEVDEWRAARPTLAAALIGITAPGRNVSVATKMLHLKRPRLFPVLDKLVVQTIGGRYYTGKSAIKRAERSLEFIEHLRSQALASRPGLEEIQLRLEAVGISRSLTRTLDGLLWMTNPASGLAPIGPVIARWRRDDGIGQDDSSPA